MTLDADQTIWDFHAVLPRALRAVVDEIYRRFPNGAFIDITVETLQERRDAIAACARGRPHSLEHVRLESFREALAAADLPDDGFAEELTERFMKERFEAIELYEDAEPALRALRRRGLTVGLLTNGNTDPERCGLANVFDFVVSGPDHGLEKPDTAIFRIAESLAGAHPRELAHVGDDWDDIAGATAAGWAPVLINRAGKHLTYAADAIAEIRSLSQLPPLLERLDGAA